ncbi:hypothetical protein [Nostoc sp.]
MILTPHQSDRAFTQGYTYRLFWFDFNSPSKRSRFHTSINLIISDNTAYA